MRERKNICQYKEPTKTFLKGRSVDFSLKKNSVHSISTPKASSEVFTLATVWKLCVRKSIELIITATFERNVKTSQVKTSQVTATTLHRRCARRSLNIFTAATALDDVATSGQHYGCNEASIAAVDHCQY